MFQNTKQNASKAIENLKITRKVKKTKITDKNCGKTCATVSTIADVKSIKLALSTKNIITKSPKTWSHFYSKIFGDIEHSATQKNIIVICFNVSHHHDKLYDLETVIMHLSWSHWITHMNITNVTTIVFNCGDLYVFRDFGFPVVSVILLPWFDEFFSDLHLSFFVFVYIHDNFGHFCFLSFIFLFH